MVNFNRSRKKSSDIQPYRYSTTVHEAHKSSVYGAAFNPYTTDSDGSYYLATCGSRFLNLYKVYTERKQVEHILQFQDANVGSLIAFCLYNLRDCLSFRGYAFSKDEGFYAVTWAYDRCLNKHVIVVGGAKGIIRVVDPITKCTSNTLRGHGEAVNEIRTSPKDSMIVASASKDRTARLWNIRSSDCLGIFGGVYGHLDEDFDVNQNYLITASIDHTVRAWDLRPATPLGKRIAATYQKSHIESLPAEEIHFPLAVSRDVHTNYVDCCRFLDQFIISKSCENRIVLWKFGSFDLDAAGEGTLNRTETYVLHTAHMQLPKAETWFIKFDLHPQNEFLACGNEIGELHLWRLKKNPGGYPKELSDCVLASPDGMTCVRQTAFSPCGQILIAVGEQGQITRFDAT